MTPTPTTSLALTVVRQGGHLLRARSAEGEACIENSVKGTPPPEAAKLAQVLNRLPDFSEGHRPRNSGMGAVS